MRRDHKSPRRQDKKIRVAGLATLTLLLTLIGLTGGSSTVRADQSDEVTETKVEIKITGSVGADEREQIDQLVESFEKKNQSPRLTIKVGGQGKDDGEKENNGKEGKEKEDSGKEGKKKESKAEKYLFFPLTAIMLGAVAAFTVLAQGWRRARHGISPLGNVATAVAFGVVAASGFLLIFEVKLKDSGVDVKFWHVVMGTVFIYLILFHVVNNWRAWISYGRRLVRSAQARNEH